MTLSKLLSFSFLFVVFIGCNNNTVAETEAEANKTLDDWHKAAAQADFETYFGLMTKDGVFLGTDAMENWQNEEFRAYSKPHFDKEKAWTFHTIERNIYMDDEQKTIWFDELLDTQMGICRGSGILKQEENLWKVKHYVLSITIPNEEISEVITLKKASDSAFLASLKQY